MRAIELVSTCNLTATMEGRAIFFFVTRTGPVAAQSSIVLGYTFCTCITQFLTRASRNIQTTKSGCAEQFSLFVLDGQTGCWCRLHHHGCLVVDPQFDLSQGFAPEMGETYPGLNALVCEARMGRSHLTRGRVSGRQRPVPQVINILRAEHRNIDKLLLVSGAGVACL